MREKIARQLHNGGKAKEQKEKLVYTVDLTRIYWCKSKKEEIGRGHV